MVQGACVKELLLELIEILQDIDLQTEHGDVCEWRHSTAAALELLARKVAASTSSDAGEQV
jgi:hypothetical protein